MKKDKIKKPFKDTILGKIVDKAGDLVQDVPNIIAKAATGNVIGAVSDVVSQLASQKDIPEANVLLRQATSQMKEIDLEFAKIDLEETKAVLLDIQDARANRKEKDWMFNLVTIVGLMIVAFIIYAVIYVDVPEENRDLFIHLIGMIEGAVFIKIFTFFFGSSKGSKDKELKMSNT